MPNISDTPPEQRPAADAGFSLVELMVVVFIMGLLATVIVINVLPSGEQARLTKAQADIAKLEGQLDQYNFTFGRYPTTQEGLQALVTAPSSVDASKYPQGGYIRKLQSDPWGNAYQYAIPGERSGWRYDIFSSGADGTAGTADDIGNWTP